MAQTANERFEAGTNGSTLTTGNTTLTNVTLTNTTCVFDNATVKLGALSAKVAQTAAFGTASMSYAAFTSTATQYARLYFNIPAIPVGGTLYIAGMYNASTVEINRCAITSGGVLIVQDNTTTVATLTTVLSINTWYRIEWDLTGTTSSFRLFVGDATAATETVTPAMAGTTFTHLVTGIIASSNSTTATIYFDEVVTDGAATPGPAVKAATSTGATVDGGTGTAAGVATAAGSTVDGGTGTARAAVSTTGSTVDGGSATARAAVTTTGSTVDGGSATARAAITVTGGTITTGSASNGIAATATGGTVTVGVGNATFPTVLVFRPPVREFDPPIADDTPEIQIVPAIYFTDLIPKGTNVFLTVEGVLTEEQPLSWDSVNKVYWGGHENYITAAEAATISAVSAEYAAHVFAVPAGPNTPAPTGVGSGGTGGTGGTGSTGNYGDGNYGDGTYT